MMFRGQYLVTFYNVKINYFSYLIFNSDLCAQGVVSVPLFGEGQAVF